MSNLNDYFYLGKVIKLHGYEGKVSIYLDTDNPDEYAEMEVVYLNIQGNPVPFFITEISILNNKGVVKFSDVDDIEKAEEIVNKEIYLPLSMLPERTGNKFYYHEIPGMIVVDENFGELGPISSILEYPNMAVIQVFYNKKEVLIPISDEIIKDVNREDNIMTVVSPEGLLDIYINTP
jgi:16S rRNA processing protein RimM